MVSVYIQVGHVCGDSMDLVAGIPTGSVRVSFGYMSTWEDVENLIGFIKDCFLEVKELVAPTEGNECARSSPEVPVTVSLAAEMEGNVLSTKEQITVVSDGLHFTDVTLENIFLYPVKSCGCFKVSHHKHVMVRHGYLSLRCQNGLSVIKDCYMTVNG